MGSCVRRIESLCQPQFFQGGGFIMQIEPGGAESVVPFRPFRPEIYCGLKLLQRFSRVSLVFERQGEVVIGRRIFWFKFQRLAIVRDGLVPGPLLREMSGVVSVGVSRLREQLRSSYQ